MSATNNKKTAEKIIYQMKLPAIPAFEMEYYFQNEKTEYAAKIFPPHLHDDLEIYILVDGDASFMVENNLYKLQAGDAIVTKANEMHNCILNSRSVHRHLCFWFDTSCEFLFAPFLSHEFGEGNLIRPTTAEDKEKLLQIYDGLAKAGETGDKLRQFYLALEMLDFFSRHLSSAGAEATIPKLLRVILDDINKNFVEINTLDYFTEKYFLSQSTLNRMFRTYLHTSPKLYLETKRLAYSRLLLKEGKSVFEACTLAGFPDYSNYIRLFKARFSTTPKKYRDS